MLLHVQGYVLRAYTLTNLDDIAYCAIRLLGMCVYLYIAQPIIFIPQ